MADNILDDCVPQKAIELFTKPCQLPINVAFKILSWEKVQSRYKDGTTTKCILKVDDHTKFMVFPGAKYDNVADSKLDAINESIKSEANQWYLITRFWTAENLVPVCIVPHSKKEQERVPTFDCNIHKILKVDRSGNLIGTDSDSPSKKFKRELQ